MWGGVKRARLLWGKILSFMGGTKRRKEIQNDIRNEVVAIQLVDDVNKKL